MDPVPQPAPAAPRSWQTAAQSGLPMAVFVGALILFLSTLSAQYSEGEDSAGWVVRVTSEPFSALINPHHIAFLAFSRVIYQLWLWCGYVGDAALSMKVSSAVAGALTLSLMATALRRLDANVALILAWVAATAAAYGFWSYSTQPETYLLSLPAVLLGVNVLIGLADDRFSPWSLGLLGGLMSFATLINQMNVLLVPTTALAIVLIWYRRRPELSASRLIAGLASFGGVSATIIGAAYFGVTMLVLGLRDLDSIFTWSRGYASAVIDSSFSWTDPVKGVIGIARVFLGGHFLFGFDWFNDAFTRLLPRKLMMEERYLALGLSPGVRITCLIALAVVGLSGMYILACLALRRAQPVNEQPAERRRFFALDTFVYPTLLSYYAFNVYWEPVNNEFFVTPLPIAMLAIASLFARRPPAKQCVPAAALFAASLFVLNGLGSILPQSSLDSDYWYQANLYLMRNAGEGDVIVTDGGFLSDWYLKLFTKSTVVTVHRVETAELSRHLSEKLPGRLWISSWAFEPPPKIRLANREFEQRDEPAIQAALAKVKPRLVKKDENAWQTVWQLEP
jgi:hypothetical protein